MERATFMSPAHRKKLSDRKKAMWATPGFKEWYFTHVKPRLPRRKDGGYWRVRCPAHPRADRNGYVIEQRLIVEKHLGRYLTNNEIVHHINHNKFDNRLENLKVMTHSEHAKIHNRKPPYVKKKVLVLKAIQIYANYQSQHPSYQSLAKKYAVSYSTIYRILTGRSHAAATGLDPSRILQYGKNILTANQVLSIRTQYATRKFSQIELAKQYRTSQPNIHAIVMRKRWKHI